MRKTLILTLLALLGLTGYAQNTLLVGDVNHDNVIDVADQIILSNIILQKQAPEVASFSADGKITYNTVKTVQLINAVDFNVAIKQLVDRSASIISFDGNVQLITFMKRGSADGTLVSTSSSQGEARAVYNPAKSEIIIYVDGDVLELPANSSSMFFRFRDLVSIDWGTSTGLRLNTSNVTDMNAMFDVCASLRSLDLSQFDTQNVTNMCAMFYQCDKLESIVFGEKFDTRNVTNMSGMFGNCYSLPALDLSCFITKKVTDMSDMFGSCYVLEDLKLGTNFTISDACDASHIVSAIAHELPGKCTITCTPDTQTKIEGAQGTDATKIIWNTL